MLLLSLAFLAGQFWLHQLSVIDFAHCRVPVALALLLALLPASRRLLTVPVIVTFLCGFVWAGWHAQQQLRDDLSPELEGQDFLVTGYIADIPERETYGQRFVLQVEHSEVELPEKIELTWYDLESPLQAAERWQLQVRLKRRHGFANPGGQDYEGQLFRKGLGATGYVRDDPDNQRLGHAALKVLSLRAQLTTAIARALPQAPMQGVIRGLAVGDQQAISSEAWQVFARTGTSHLMAISGFHIGMVAWLCAWLGGQLVRLPMAQRWRLTRPDLRAVFGISAAVAYSLLAGMSIPTQRTLIMVVVYFVAQLLRREVSVWHSFGLALLAVLVADPFATLSVGLWLSFGAVAVILLNQQGRLEPAKGWRNLLGVQGVVTVGLVPLLLTSFGGLSLVSPWVNLLAIPLFTAVVVPLVLLACGLLALMPAAGTLALQSIARLLDGVYAGLSYAANLPWAMWYAPAVPWWISVLLLLGTAMMVLPWLGTLRLAGLLATLPALLYQPVTPRVGEFELTALDVGQGLAVVVRTTHHALLYDTGPVFQSGRDTGELVVLPFLRASGIRQLDRLVLSHGDNDHTGGAASVRAGMLVQQMLVGPSVSGVDSAKPCRAGQHWQWDGVEFEVVHPGTETWPDDNNSSCVLRIHARGGSALLTGDIESEAEAMLVESGAALHANIVVAPHHGSRSSSTVAFIQATRPVGAQWVLFSAGYRNRWGFPKVEVEQRWLAAGARPNNTAVDGALQFQVTGKGIAWQRYRTAGHRYWWH